jgi:uncharacterized Zn finger protein
MGNLRAGYWAHQSLDARAQEHTMEELNFLVKGSSADPYEVTFIKDGSSLTALCTCPAGTYGNFCKHRISILDGITKMITSDNANQVATVVGWLAGTDVETALSEMRQAEKIADPDKTALNAAKRKLARAMNS